MSDKNLLEDPEDADTEFGGVFCTDNGQIVDAALINKVFEITLKSKRNLSKNVYDDVVKANKFSKASDIFKYDLDRAIDDDECLAAKKELVYAIFDWFLRYETIDNCCNSMNEVSITSYTGWSDWGDGTLINFRGGYCSLVKWFMANIPEGIVNLSKRVTKIQLRDSKREDVESKGKSIQIDYCNDNTEGDKEENSNSVKSILCDHVIFTGSLGFLKEHHASLFHPALPTSKQLLIDAMGFGTVNKIFLHFDKPFWGNHAGIKLLWREIDRDRRLYPDWAYDIIGFDVVRRQPNLLLGWIGGQGAKLMELETNDTVANVCLNILNSFWPQSYDSPSRLTACICSRWNSNPFIKGSYSFQSMESFHHQVEDLQEPICGPDTIADNNNFARSIPRIMFAGEATSGDLYSTSHGAIVSGWREADRLIEYYKNELI